jgi:hypothetical protein
MACAWIELPGSGWGETRVAIGQLEDQGYAVGEIRGAGPVLLRLSGVRLERGELLRMPGGLDRAAREQCGARPCPIVNVRGADGLRFFVAGRLGSRRLPRRAVPSR